MHFAGGGIDALLVCRGTVLRSSEPDSTAYGIAQLRRYLAWGPLRVLHLVFAPECERPLLLGLVRLENQGPDLLPVEYSEIWDVRGGDYRAEPGGAERWDVDGVRALADLAVGVRSHSPETASPRGLALDLSLALPPRSRRELCFGYLRGDPGEPVGTTLRAWRGEVRGALAHTVQSWEARLPGGSDPIAAYSAEVSRVGEAL